MSFLPEVPEPFVRLAAELGVRDQDLQEQFTRGGGKGGQKINKTASTVQLTHLPTGTSVRVQKHREQSKNRLSAYKLLLLKLEQQIKGTQSQIDQEIFKARRRKARRTRKSKLKMLDQKHHRSEIKEQRKPIL